MRATPRRSRSSSSARGSASSAATRSSPRGSIASSSTRAATCRRASASARPSRCRRSRRAGRRGSDPSRLAMLGDLRRDLVDGLSQALRRPARRRRPPRRARPSYEEIARAASMPVGTAKSYVHRGRGARLRVAARGAARHRVRAAARQARDRGDPPPPRAVPPARRGDRDRTRARASSPASACGRTSGTSPGHFPGRPIMPGVLMVEALAQTGAVAVLSEEENRGQARALRGIDDVRFKRLVDAGRRARAVCDLERVRGPIGRGKATRDGRRRARGRGTLTFARHGRRRVIANVDERHAGSGSPASAPTCPSGC